MFNAGWRLQREIRVGQIRHQVFKSDADVHEFIAMLFGSLNGRRIIRPRQEIQAAKSLLRHQSSICTACSGLKVSPQTRAI